MIRRPYISAPLIRAILVAIFAAILTSCLATTNKLAVFEETVLSQEQVDALTGYYAWVGEKTNVSSLILSARENHWSYRPTQRATNAWQQSPERTLELASASFTLKSLTIFDDGSSSIIVLMGVAVFSKIPDTDLILMSIPGETLRVSDDGSMRPASERNASTNLFFVLRKDGNEIKNQYYQDDDQLLKAAIGDPSKPLPVDRLLDYLEEQAEERFLASELPTYSLATPQKQKLIEQEMNAALSEDREKKTRESASPP